MKKRIVLWILLFGVLACASIGLAQNLDAIPAAVDGKTADRIHLREKPSGDSGSLGLYFTGTEVLCKADDIGKDWVWVQVGAEAGYMKAEYLFWGPDLRSVIPRQPIGIVSDKKPTNWVNMRCNPSQDSDVACRLYNGDVVTILGETATKWYYVRMGDQFGYVLSDFLETARPASPGTSVLAVLKSALNSNTPYVSFFENRMIYLSQLPDLVADARIEVSQFAVVDLEYDGIAEVILRLKANGNDAFVQVLRYRDGLVFGYTFGLREMGEIKADGTFHFSNSAAENGIGTLVFYGNVCSVDEITYSQATNNHIAYFVNKIAATEGEFALEENNQERKPDVDWLPFTADNIDAVL